MQKCSKRSSHWTFRQFYPKNGVVLIDALGELRRERVFFFSNKEKSASDPTRSFCYFFSFLNYSIGRATLYHNLRRRRGDVRRQREWRMTPMRGWWIGRSTDERDAMHDTMTTRTMTTNDNTTQQRHKKKPPSPSPRVQTEY